MSRTKRGSKGDGYDYWGRRALSGNCGYGPKVKDLTHRIERHRVAGEIKREVHAEHEGPVFTFTCARCGNQCEEHERSGKTNECMWC